MDFFYRHGTIRREVVKTPKLDFCALTGLAVSNPLTTLIFKALNDSIPGIIHRCPYDMLVVQNLQINIDHFPIFPQGEYTMEFNFTKFNEVQIGHAAVIGKLMSPKRNWDDD